MLSDDGFIKKMERDVAKKQRQNDIQKKGKQDDELMTIIDTSNMTRRQKMQALSKTNEVQDEEFLSFSVGLPIKSRAGIRHGYQKQLVPQTDENRRKQHEKILEEQRKKIQDRQDKKQGKEK